VDHEMKIAALAPWFGAKRTLASAIIAEMGPHGCYWEPLCGSLSVLLAKPAVAAETLNDAHGGLTSLASLLTEPGPTERLYRRLSSTLYSEHVWRASVTYCALNVDRPWRDRESWAYHYLVASWLARNGYGGTDSAFTSFAARFSATGGTTAGRWRSVVDWIPAWHERLRNVTILNRRWQDVIPRIDDAEGTVIYVDPPYLYEGHRYDHAFGPDEHCDMAAALARFRRARVLVSYYDVAEVRHLYDGWTIVPMAAPKFLAKSGQREATGECPVAPEILIINGPSLAARARETQGGLFQ